MPVHCRKLEFQWHGGEMIAEERESGLGIRRASKKGSGGVLRILCLMALHMIYLITFLFSYPPTPDMEDPLSSGYLAFSGSLRLQECCHWTVQCKPLAAATTATAQQHAVGYGQRLGQVELSQHQLSHGLINLKVLMFISCCCWRILNLRVHIATRFDFPAP